MEEAQDLQSRIDTPVKGNTGCIKCRLGDRMVLWVAEDLVSPSEPHNKMPISSQVELNNVARIGVDVLGIVHQLAVWTHRHLMGLGRVPSGQNHWDKRSR